MWSRCGLFHLSVHPLGYPADADNSGGALVKIKYFIVISSCLLYLIAAGLFSRGVWLFEAYSWSKVIGSDADELGNGPGTYDIRKSVWYVSYDQDETDMLRHVNCCNPESTSNGGWGIFNAILGWQNSATVGSVVSYCIYWIVVTLALIWMRVDERRVANGKASLWRVMTRRGPKPRPAEIRMVDDDLTGTTEDGVKGKIHTGVERDVQNLDV